jgi:hypothetical protein
MIDVLAIDLSEQMIGLALVDRFWQVCSAMYAYIYKTDNLTLNPMAGTQHPFRC